jgi:GTPase
VDRKLSIPQFQGRFPDILLTDTVGFIQKLPTHLVAAFRATLEEIYMADVLVHLVDVSNPMWRKQRAIVDQTLEDMGVAEKPTITLYNKLDELEVRRPRARWLTSAPCVS